MKAVLAAVLFASVVGTTSIAQAQQGPRVTCTLQQNGFGGFFQSPPLVVTRNGANTSAGGFQLFASLDGNCTPGAWQCSNRLTTRIQLGSTSSVSTVDVNDTNERVSNSLAIGGTVAFANCDVSP